MTTCRESGGEMGDGYQSAWRIINRASEATIMLTGDPSQVMLWCGMH